MKKKQNISNGRGGARKGAGRKPLLLDPQTRLYYDRYNSQRIHAKIRNIDWQFTFEEWLHWWGDDIVNRGRKRGQLVMARNGDTGPYHPDNVRKTTCTDNHKDTIGDKDGPRTPEFCELKRQQAIAQHKAAGHTIKEK